MEFLKKRKSIIITTIIYLGVISFLFSKNILDPNNIITIIIAIPSGFMGWAITHSFQSWFDKEEKEKEKKSHEKIDTYVEKDFPSHKEQTNQIFDIAKGFPVHNDKTTEILDILKKKHIALVKRQRKDINYDFLEKYFKYAKEVKISGIANKSLIEDLSNKVENHTLLTSLRNNENVSVDILMADSRSEYIGFRDIIELREAQLSSSEGIKNTIRSIYVFSKQLNGKKLTHQKNHLEIRMTKIPFYSTLTYIKYLDQTNGTHEEKEIMFLGFLFAHEVGDSFPIFEIPKNDSKGTNPLFQNALDNFNKIFSDGITDRNSYPTLFRWNNEGVFFNEEFCKKINNIDTLSLNSGVENMSLEHKREIIPGDEID